MHVVHLRTMTCATQRDAARSEVAGASAKEGQLGAGPARPRATGPPATHGGSARSQPHGSRKRVAGSALQQAARRTCATAYLSCGNCLARDKKWGNIWWQCEHQEEPKLTSTCRGVEGPVQGF